MSEHVVKASATQNEEGEKVGVINRAFSYINHAREAGQRMKTNYHAYYALKYAVVALLAAGIVYSALA